MVSFQGGENRSRHALAHPPSPPPRHPHSVHTCTHMDLSQGHMASLWQGCGALSWSPTGRSSAEASSGEGWRSLCVHTQPLEGPSPGVQLRAAVTKGWGARSGLTCPPQSSGSCRALWWPRDRLRCAQGSPTSPERPAPCLQGHKGSIRSDTKMTPPCL